MGTPWEATFTVNVPDWIDAEPYLGLPLVLPVESIRIHDVAGLPAGFDWNCNPGSCLFPPNTSACVYLFGTPDGADVGIHTVAVERVFMVTLFGQSSSIPLNESYTFSITIGDPADVGLIKTVDNAYPLENDVITYTVIASNAGPTDATGLTVLDRLPVGVAYVADTSPDYNSISRLWRIGNLISGSSTTLQITAQVDASTVGSSITNRASVTALSQTDTNSINDQDIAVITVVPRLVVDIKWNPSNDQMQMSWPCLSRWTYRLESTTNLTSALPWNIVLKDIAATPPSNVVPYEVGRDLHRHFRVKGMGTEGH